MPAKFVKLNGGRVVTVESIRLANGNLLIPRRREDDRTQVDWAEVEPGTSDYKRWLPVAEDKPDPRKEKA
jgi:hypothetical protein